MKQESKERKRTKGLQCDKKQSGEIMKKLKTDECGLKHLKLHIKSDAEPEI